jgi:hypothetical protein
LIPGGESYYLAGGYFAGDYAATGILTQDVDGSPALTLAQLAYMPSEAWSLYAGRTALSVGATEATVSSFIVPASQTITTSNTVRALQRSLLQPDWSAALAWSPALGHDLTLTYLQREATVLAGEPQVAGLEQEPPPPQGDPTPPPDEGLSAVLGGVGNIVDFLLLGERAPDPERPTLAQPQELPVEAVQLRYSGAGFGVSVSADAALLSTPATELLVSAVAFIASVGPASLVGELVSLDTLGSVATVGLSGPLIGLDVFGHYTRAIDRLPGEEITAGALVRNHRIAARLSATHTTGPFFSGVDSRVELALSFRF